MKSKTILLSMVVFILFTVSISGCSAFNAAELAEETLIEYYKLYNEEEIDKCNEMFDDSIIEDIGDEDLAEVIFTSRRYLLGKVISHNVLSFDSDSSSKEAQVVLSVETEYENAEEVIEEEYIFHLEGDKVKIIGIDIGGDPIVSQLVNEYFSDYTDMEEVKKFYIPYVVNNAELFNEDSVSILADYAYESGGEYASHNIEEFNYYYDKLDWTDTTYFLAQILAEMEFDKEKFMLYAEISKEDDDVKFNYLEYYPLDAYNIVDNYYNNIANKDTNSIMGMYSEEFFESSEISQEEWETSILDSLVNDYGAFTDYAIYTWEYSTISFNNQDFEVYSFLIATEFENVTFEEHLTIIKGKTNKAVIGHQIY